MVDNIDFNMFESQVLQKELMDTLKNLKTALGTLKNAFLSNLISSTIWYHT